MAKNQPILIDIGPGLSMMVGFPTISTWKNNERPKNAKRGTFGFNTDTQNLEYYDGHGWLAAAMQSDSA